MKEKRAMIIEEAFVMKLAMYDIFKNKGYNVFISEEKNALENFINFEPDLVYIGINEDRLDEIELLKESVKIDDKVIINNKAIVKILTFKDKLSLIREAIEEGVIDYIIESFKDEKLFKLIS